MGIVLAAIVLVVVAVGGTMAVRWEDRHLGHGSPIDLDTWTHGIPRAHRGRVLSTGHDGTYRLVPPVRLDPEQRQLLAIEMRSRLGRNVSFEPDGHGVVREVVADKEQS